jgi:hypothetical protein
MEEVVKLGLVVATLPEARRNAQKSEQTDIIILSRVTEKGAAKMEFDLMLAFQVAITTAAVIVVNRKLMLQNIAFRNQLGVYLRTIKKTKIKSQIRDRDRKLWLIRGKLLDDWSDYLVIVKPETVINWEKQRFNRFWFKKSREKGKVGRPRIADQHIEFIRRISGDHPEMGSQKIADELYLKFGITHSPETIRKYRLPRRRLRGDQTWRTFVKNHAKEIFACDFLTQHTIALRVFFIFVVMEVGKIEGVRDIKSRTLDQGH